MQVFLAVCTGLGLAAACGLRVFLPLFIVAIAVKAEWISPPDAFDWIGETPALVVFGVASVIEISGFMFPWVDHALDVIAVPLSAVAGAVLMTMPLLAVATGDNALIHPAVAWSLGIVAGVATASGVEAASIAGRLSSSVLTIGWLNPIYAVIETVLAFLLVVMSIMVPMLAGILVMLLLPVLLIAVWRILVWRRKLRLAQQEKLRKARERIAASMAHRAAAGA
ncbi:MAG: DUF4126 domain-containing protein [Phycisphaerae bacterium]|nr:DUF4126 domain-containing protein [Phycisphaerae bacterium]